MTSLKLVHGDEHSPNPRIRIGKPVFAAEVIFLFTDFIAAHQSGHLAVSVGCGLSGLWLNAHDPWFLVLELLSARCVALENLHSSAGW